MPSRLTVLAKEARAHWKPHGATQSQPRGEREEGGEQDGEERWRRVEARFFCFVPPPMHHLDITVSCAILSPSHMDLKISVDLLHIILNHCLTC